MPSNKKLLQAAAGNAGESLYVEDVFSTYLYTGNGSSQTITNGIDLAGEGGAIWFKSRSNATNHRIFDTDRGRSVALTPDTTAANGAVSPAGDDLASFNSDGFTLGAPFHYGLNTLNRTYASWSFREAEKFFDVVTYTGNGVAGRTVAHNLGSTPATIIIKCTTDTQSWVVYHTSLGATKYLTLNTANASGTTSVTFNDTEPTDSVFTVGTAGSVNASGQTYVAYLFAHDAGGFGDDGSENIIKCGSYTGNGNYTTGNAVNVGFEPQWLLIKNTSRAHSNSDWVIYDVMRGYTATNQAQAGLFANLSNAETTSGGKAYNSFITSSGFHLMDSNEAINFNGDTYIYIAIRRPMKTPESGTEVFATAFDAGGTSPTYVSGFVADMGIQTNTTGYNKRVSSRLTSGRYLEADNTGAEQTSASNYTWDFMNGWNNQTINSTWFSWMFKRATGFMDAVAYTGNGTAGHTLNHNLGVAPELIIIKDRDAVTGWYVGVNFEVSAFDLLQLQSTNAASSRAYSHGIDAKPTANLFSVGVNTFTNTSSENYIAYLFATLAGVSKVGSVAHSGTTNVDCGFSAGARFVLVKRTDSSGDWYVWDSVRGIVAGNDPYLLLNSTAAEVTNTDYIDPLSSGFTLTSSFTAGTYIFLAIA
jgi:hypothetical protein